MNKLYIIFGFCFVSSLSSMDLIVINDMESNNFAVHLNMAVKFGEIAIQKGDLSVKNPIYTILAQLRNNLAVNYNNDIRNMIKGRNLFDSLKKYHEVENHDVVKFGLAQIRSNVANVDEAKKFVIRYRLLQAGFKLAQKHPTYSNPWMGETQKEERINYMLRNTNYPIHEEAKQDYTVMFIYQLLFAPKVS